MKTKAYSLIYTFALIFSTLAILSTLPFLSVLCKNIKYIQTESYILDNKTITLGFAIKVCIFVNLSVFLITIYSFNLMQKTLMKLANYINIICSIITNTIIYYFYNHYPKYYKDNIQSMKIKGTKTIIYSYMLSYDVKDPRTTEEKIFDEIKPILNYFIYYEILASICLIIIILSLIISMKIQIEETFRKPVVLSTISKSGLNTVSLREKRVVVAGRA